MHIEINNAVESISNNSFLFHYKSFVTLRHANLLSFTLKESKTALAQIFFNKTDRIITSIPYAPFGGFDTYKSIGIHQLTYLIDEVIAYAKSKNIEQISINTIPKQYNPTLFNLQKRTLLQHGFTIEQQNTMQYIHITPYEFVDIITADKRRYLNKATQFNFQLLPPEKLIDIYHFIKQGRTIKKYALSIDETNLQNLSHTFPDRVKLFGLYNENKLLAAVITLKVNNDILLDFHHEDNPKYRHLSASTPLLRGLYDYCKTENYKILDLGGSMLSNKLNVGLYNFKKSVGAKASTKLVFMKVLS